MYIVYKFGCVLQIHKKGIKVCMKWEGNHPNGNIQCPQFPPTIGMEREARKVCHHKKVTPHLISLCRIIERKGPGTEG